MRGGDEGASAVRDLDQPFDAQHALRRAGTQTRGWETPAGCLCRLMGGPGWASRSGIKRTGRL